MMASRVLAICCVCVIHRSLAVPVDLPGDPSSSDVVFVTEVVTSSVNMLDIATSVVTAAAPPLATSVLLFPGSLLPAQINPVAPTQVTPSATSTSSPPVTTTDILTDTVTTTFTDPPTTVTVSASPTTVTDVITIISSSSSTTAQTVWAAPPQMTDLDAFNVTKFAYGQNNMRVVPSSPSNASDANTTFVTDDKLAISETDADEGAPTTWNSSSAALELFYPANSVNPSSEPQGGADFYAAPLDLTGARNVSLAYSVFFPADFDWVQAGKLPGLYGGHDGCSGGNDAKTCFSTRLMWRAGGAGELYLYAPKDRQTAALCATPPLSVCDAEYGLSIGRGAFNWTAGAWTHVRQTVTLNTPGQQDGAFVLEVNGGPAIAASDVFYRDVPGASESDGSDADDGDDDPDDGDGDPDEDLSSGDGEDASDSGNDDQGAADCGLLALGCSLDEVVSAPETGSLLVRDDVGGAPSSSATLSPAPLTSGAAPSGPQPSVLQETMTDSITSTVTAPASTDTVSWTMTSTSTAYSSTPTDDTAAGGQAPGPEPVGFIGLFFSTFFGGHEQKYATPKDQYAWFKDFSMTVND